MDYVIWEDGIVWAIPKYYTLAQVAQRGGGCPVPGDAQGQAGRGSEHLDPAVGVPVHCRGVGPDGL